MNAFLAFFLATRNAFTFYAFHHRTALSIGTAVSVIHFERKKVHILFSLLLFVVAGYYAVYSSVYFVYHTLCGIPNSSWFFHLLYGDLFYKRFHTKSFYSLLSLYPIRCRIYMHVLCIYQNSYILLEWFVWMQLPQKLHENLYIAFGCWFPIAWSYCLLFRFADIFPLDDANAKNGSRFSFVENHYNVWQIFEAVKKNACLNYKLLMCVINFHMHNGLTIHTASSKFLSFPVQTSLIRGWARDEWMFKNHGHKFNCS